MVTGAVQQSSIQYWKNLAAELEQQNEALRNANAEKTELMIAKNKELDKLSVEWEEARDEQNKSATSLRLIQEELAKLPSIPTEASPSEDDHNLSNFLRILREMDVDVSRSSGYHRPPENSEVYVPLHMVLQAMSCVHNSALRRAEQRNTLLIAECIARTKLASASVKLAEIEKRLNRESLSYPHTTWARRGQDGSSVLFRS